MTFELQYTDSKTNARAGLITTDHGQIETPIFMPVGTVGTVKGVDRRRRVAVAVHPFQRQSRNRCDGSEDVGRYSFKSLQP